MPDEEDKIVMHFCSEKCFYSGISELIFAYLKEHGASKKLINTAVNIISPVVECQLDILQRRVKRLNEDIATF